MAVTLDSDISSSGSALTLSCNSSTLDLNGYDFTLRNIAISAGTTFTITDTNVETPGHLIADASAISDTAGIQNTGATLVVNGTALVTTVGGQNAAGIGGGLRAFGGTATISGTAGVSATGGENGAGIGGGYDGLGGTTTISGLATVSATGGASGAGIGGGFARPGGTTSIGGAATVSATGGASSAGIGGGFGGAGGTAQILDSSFVTATGGSRGSAIGAFDGQAGFGSLIVDGTLSLPAGILVITDSTVEGVEVTVGETGKIIGTRDAPTVGAQISGVGQIDNGGSISLSVDGVTGGSPALTQVYDRYYVVSFDTQSGSSNPADETVFAKSFDDGSRTFPTEPTKSGSTFLGWNTAADGSGIAVATASTLPGRSTDGAPVAVTAYAQWAPVVESAIILNLSVAVGDPVTNATVTVSGAGLRAGSDYSLIVRSSPVTIASGNASSTGAFSASGVIPAGLAAGQHTVTLNTISANGTVLSRVAYFTLNASGTVTYLSASRAEGTPVLEAALAATGIDPLPFGAVALLLLVAGSAVLIRRRATTD